MSDSTSIEDERAERAKWADGTRWVAFWGALAFGAVLAGGGLAEAANSLGATAGEVGVATAANTLEAAVRLYGTDADERRRTIAFLGDSKSVSFDLRWRVPTQLDDFLARRTKVAYDVDVVDFAAPGMGPASYFYVADLIEAGDPNVVVWQLSDNHFSERWLGRERKELAGWVSAARIPTALALPLEETGLTLDRLLGYQALVRFVGADDWKAAAEALSRVEKLRGRVEAEIGGARSVTRFRRAVLRERETPLLEARPDRFTLEGERATRGAFVEDGLGDDDPTLAFLAGTVEELARGRDVLVYLHPINVEHLRFVGALDGEGLARSIDAVRAAVEGAGATFVDLHDLLPDDSFRDGAGHLRRTGTSAGPAGEIVDAIGRELLRGPLRDITRGAGPRTR